VAIRPSALLATPVILWVMVLPGAVRAAQPDITRLRTEVVFASFRQCTDTLCTSTLIFFQAETVAVDGVPSTSTRLQQFNQFIVDSVTGEFVAQTFAEGDPDATLRINGGLSRAEASSSFSLTTCEGLPPSNCTTAPATLALSLVGTGDLGRIPNQLVQNFEGLTIIFTGSFLFRQATPSGSLDGADLGEPIFGQISRTSNGSITVCRRGSPFC
jgi:hypothetical protein